MICQSSFSRGLTWMLRKLCSFLFFLFPSWQKHRGNHSPKIDFKILVRKTSFSLDFYSDLKKRRSQFVCYSRFWCMLRIMLKSLKRELLPHLQWDALTIELLGLRWQSKGYDKWNTLTIELLELRRHSKVYDKWDTLTM